MNTSEQKAMVAVSGDAIALHGQAGDDHLVGIGNLRVVICNEDGHWFAQGLEIDYASDGLSFDEVKKNFEDGLRGTIDLHLKVYGNLDHFLKIAPSEAWAELLKFGKRMRYTQVSTHTVLSSEMAVNNFPFGAINYLESEAVQAA